MAGSMSSDTAWCVVSVNEASFLKAEIHLSKLEE